MEWYGNQNARSKEVAEFVDSFTNLKTEKRVYTPIKLTNSRGGFDKHSKFKHVSDQLIDIGYKIIESEHNWKLNLEDDSLRYDLIFADLPINIRPQEGFIFDDKIKVGPEFNHLAISLNKLKENGRLFCLFPGVIMFGTKHEKILHAIEQNGFYYNLIIKSEKLWENLTNIDLYLLCFEKKQSTKLFVGTFENGNQKILFNNYSKKLNKNLRNGSWVERETFITIDNLIHEEQIKLKGDYSGYPLKNIREISNNIERGRYQKKLTNGKNVIFIPSIGSSNVVIDIKKTNLKSQNLFKIELDENLVLNEYAAFFLNTDIGISYRKSLEIGAAIKTIPTRYIENLLLYLPSIDEQKEVVQIWNKLNDLVVSLEAAKKNLAYNPKNIIEISSTLNKLNSKLTSLTEVEKILDIIEQGENKKVEFKETFSFNRHNNNKRDEELIKSSIKNIVAFLNSDGGILIIGVKDNGEISGIENEIGKWNSKDKFKLFFSDIVEKKIGDAFNNYVNYRIQKVGDKEIFIVDCKKSKRPCYFNKKEFYIRLNPKAKLLEGIDSINYIKERFSLT